jgi:hypothetical protein
LETLGFPTPANKMMAKAKYILLLIILLADLGYSFYQHYHMPLYGDMADVVMPTPPSGYYQVLHDPLGLNALLKNEIYPNPNRFFAHLTASEYFLYVPLLFQKFTDPIDSIYLSSAIAKTIIQLLIIYLLAVYISNTLKPFKLEFIIAALLVSPFFQASGFARTMGIIDQSVIYTFFYALPLGLLLLFFLPLFKIIYYNKIPKFNAILIILMILFIFFLALNGPLVPGVVLIACPLALIGLWLNNYRQKEETMPVLKRSISAFIKIPYPFTFFFIGFCVLSLYSLYIGRNNSLNYGFSIPLADRYSALPTGIYNLITKKIAFPLLLSMIAINVIIIQKNYKSAEGSKILGFIKWIGVFAIIYILLLPMGGFRYYRENIVRYDTIMPVTLGLIFAFGSTSYYLIRVISKKYKKIYVSSLIALLLVYTNADRLNTKPYECERNALETIARSPEKIVMLDCDCSVMDWHKLDDYRLSERNAELFEYWKVTNELKYYFHKN